MKKLLMTTAAAVFFVPAVSYAQAIGTGNNFDEVRDEIGIARDGTFEGYATAQSIGDWVATNITLSPDGAGGQNVVVFGVVVGNVPVDVSATGLALSGDTLTLTMSDGATFPVDLSEYDDSAAVASVLATLNAHIASDLDVDPNNELGGLIIAADGTTSYSPTGNASAGPVDMATQSELDAHIAADLDLDPTNELQDLTRTGDVLALTGSAPTVDLSDFRSPPTTYAPFDAANGGTSGTDVFVDGVFAYNIPDNDTVSPPNLDNDPNNENQDVRLNANGCRLQLYQVDTGQTLTSWEYRAEVQAHEVKVQFPGWTFQSTDLATLPVGVPTIVHTDTFTWTNPSSCSVAVLDLTSRHANLQINRLAPNNDIEISFPWTGWLAPGTKYQTVNNSVDETIQFSPSADRNVYVVPPGGTVTFDLSIRVFLGRPYIPSTDPNPTRIFSYARYVTGTGNLR